MLRKIKDKILVFIGRIGALVDFIANILMDSIDDFTDFD